MFQRDMLPPSSGWFSLVQAIAEFIGCSDSAHCTGNLRK